MSRPGYPGRVVEFITATAGLGSRAAVLEVGCGTGQLTEQLARSASRLTAIDIGPSMIAAARRRLTGAEVSFQVTSFEGLAAVDASFDLVISSAAFHWIDPEVAGIREGAAMLSWASRGPPVPGGQRRHENGSSVTGRPGRRWHDERG